MSGKARSSSESSSSDSEALSIKDDEGNFCVQNRIIRSDKNVEVEAKVKVRTRVQLVDVNLKVSFTNLPASY